MKKLLLTLSRAFPRSPILTLAALFSLTLTTNIDGQQIINAGPDQNLSTCGATTTLTAAITQTQSTNAYAVNTIPYNADPYNQGTIVPLSDDQIASNYVTLPFSFCFYGNTYTRVYICSNNWIGFSPGQTPTWQTTSIPTASGAAPKNCIMGPWQDINPASGGQVRWAVYGTAPFRRFVVSYFNVPMYLCTGALYTSQIKIYETTNIIETHISNKPLCTNWNMGHAVHGLHNANGTQAVIVNGRNNTQWTTNNEGMRFTPSGAPNYTIEWLDPNNNIVGNGANLNVTPSSTTVYTARVSYPCGNTQYTDQVQVNLPSTPTATFAIPATVCAGQTATVTYNGNASAGATYNWNFGGATVISGSGQGPYQIRWNNGGTYNVSLDVTQNGCPSTVVTQTVTVNTLPIASFTLPTTVCNPDTVQVTFTGTAINGATYNWNMNGGNIVSGSNAGPINVSWNTTGAKTVSLTVTQNGCPSAPASNNVTVYNTPTATFTANPTVCQFIGMGVTYTGTATNAANYNWNFNGATVNSGSGQGPYQIQWTTAGSHPVSLTVTENGCTSPAFSSNVLVNQQPTSTFNPTTPVCLNSPSTILYTGNAGNTATANWSFDNGTVLSGNGVGPYQISWNTAGVKTITLVVTENGCVSPQTSMVVNVDSVPVANAGADVTMCSGQQIQIGTPAIGGAIYGWTPGSGLQNSAVAQPMLTLINNTTSPVTSAYVLSVSYGNQCVNHDTLNVTVKPTPVAAFTAPQGQCLNNNEFNIDATGSFSNAAAFNWIVDNVPAPQYGSTFTTTFQTSGWHRMALTVTDFGCTSNPYTDSVKVFEMPVANFTGTNLVGCMPLTAQFNDMSTSTSGISSYKWDFQLGGATGANPTFEFTQDGIYDVTLTVTSNEGCASIFTIANYVWAKPTPVADFAVSPNVVDAIVNPYVTITNLSSAQYYWYSFGDGQTTTSPYGDHAYTNPGIYTITQVVKNSYGCTDTTYRSIESKPSQTIYLPNAFTPNNDHLNETFTAQGILVNNFTMNVYNRWGQLVFSANNMNNGWDGTYQGVICESGVYTYRITYDMVELSGTGRQQVVDGMVTLIR